MSEAITTFCRGFKVVRNTSKGRQLHALHSACKTDLCFQEHVQYIGLKAPGGFGLCQSVDFLVDHLLVLEFEIETWPLLLPSYINLWCACRVTSLW